MLDRQSAIEAAARYLAEQDPDSVGEIRVWPEHAFLDGHQLVVPYDTVDRIDHGIKDAELGGNPPITVDLRTGECGHLSWEALWDCVDRGLFS
ncbi:hypothetical protein ACFQO7_30330 [Catellatospora aurea]|uniref:Immunity protein 35 of polymorphic toxin system n=1 Tax=Catellatospora aurea TaxID=1337874 RepID=A0ABW2H3F5_9ACTN